MPDSVQLAKAELRQLDADFKNEINPDKTAKVQFNPDSLKVSFANQIATPQGAGDQKGTPARQFVGAGTTKLTLQLWFDVTAPLPEGETEEKDVRKLTQKVAYFITPTQEKGKFVPPAVRFLWGSFQFDGIMESLEESLEFFSPEGHPLRASMTLNLSQQKITKFEIKDVASGPAPASGTRPLRQAAEGDNVQSMADDEGKGDNWQGIASANGIENPRLLGAGATLDMNIGIGASASGGASISAGASFSASAAVDAGASISSSASLTAGASIQTGASLQADASLSLGG